MPQPSHRAQAFQSNLHATVGDMQNDLPLMGSVVQIRLSMFVGRQLLRFFPVMFQMLCALLVL